VLVQDGLGDAGRLGDLVHRRRVEAALAEHLDRDARAGSGVARRGAASTWRGTLPLGVTAGRPSGYRLDFRGIS
jgi:hypothetical protein